MLLPFLQVFFYKAWKLLGARLEKFYMITMQLPLFHLKLKIFPLLHRLDQIVFTLDFVKSSTYITTVSQIANLIWRYFEIFKWLNVICIEMVVKLIRSQLHSKIEPFHIKTCKTWWLLNSVKSLRQLDKIRLNQWSFNAWKFSRELNKIIIG